MFTAIEKYCRTKHAYGNHPDVRDPSRVPDDKMESFFLAETLKYLYLLQKPGHPIRLDRYVFNTEAHPTRIFSDIAPFDAKGISTRYEDTGGKANGPLLKTSRT